MPLDPFSINAFLEPALLSAGSLGTGRTNLSMGLSTGLSLYSTTQVTVNSVDVGTAGVGVGTGIGIIVPPSFPLSMIGYFQSNNMNGIFSPVIANAIAVGFMEAYALALINTASASVGVGAGVATLSPNPSVSLDIFYSNLISFGISGQQARSLASAVSGALDTTLPLCTGVLAILGTPSIVPSAGSGVGKLS